MAGSFKLRYGNLMEQGRMRYIKGSKAGNFNMYRLYDLIFIYFHDKALFYIFL